MAMPAVDTSANVGEFRVGIAGRELSILHERALVSWLDEQRYLSFEAPRQYGTVLWPASIALALEIAQRAKEFDGREVLELGAGVGLSGIAAASVGARVVQTDRDAGALAVSRENAERNGVALETRLADWEAWSIVERYDWVIASDILYRTSMHDRLRAIFSSALRPNGRLLIADPMRPASLGFLEQIEREGWQVRMTRWTIGEGDDSRTIGVFELVRPSSRTK